MRNAFPNAGPSPLWSHLPYLHNIYHTILICKHHLRNRHSHWSLEAILIAGPENCIICWTWCLDPSFPMPLTLLLSTRSLPLWRAIVAIAAIVLFQCYYYCHHRHCGVSTLRLSPEWCTCCSTTWCAITKTPLHQSLITKNVEDSPTKFPPKLSSPLS